MRKIVKFGVIGTNRITDWFLKGAFMDNRFRLVAVCSRQMETGMDFARKYGINHVFTSVEELAKSDEIDAVYIASPNSLHASQTITCINNGKHVLCEKPFASNSNEVKAMIVAARENGVVLMEAMKTTLTPNFRYLLNHLNEAGRIRRYFASYCQYSSRYDKLKEGIVLNAFKPELSNGAVMDIGVYTIYPMVVLFGRPNKISSTGLILPTGVDGQGSASFSYPDMEANVIYSKIADSFLPSEIQTEDGTITIDNIHDFRHVEFRPRSSREPVTLGDKEYMNEYYYEAKEFIDLIETGRRESSINSLENSLITMEIIDEIRRQTGVSFPADLNG